MDKQIVLSIFTPTYNRAYILNKLYDSLNSQTDKNFIWLIVDDGSTDDTETLVEKWKKENKIKIDYHKKENGGKHTAMDFANKVCTTKFIGCVDSDDYLTADAVEKVNKHIKEVSDNAIGIVYLKDMKKDYSFAKLLHNNEIYFAELEKNLGFMPETFLVFKTDFIKQYSFPKIPEERFITEGVFYNLFMLDNKILLKEDLIYVAAYLQDGYTNQGLKLFLKNPQGYLYFLKQESCLSKDLKRKLGFAAAYYAWGKALNIKDKFPNDYKIQFPFNILGRMFIWKFIKDYKNQYMEYLEKNGTK